MRQRRKFEVWSVISILLLACFLLFFVYPICTLLRQAFVNEGGNFGAAAAFATVTTVLTALSLVVYMRVTKSENIEL